MLSPNFIPARYRVLTTSRFDFPNTDVFKIPIQKHGNLFSCGHRFLHFWGSWVNGSPQPTNYAAALENTFFSPLDPFYENTQNWVGTYAVAPSAAVPEPASLTMFGLGAVGLVAGAIRRRRQAKAAV